MIFQKSNSELPKTASRNLPTQDSNQDLRWAYLAKSYYQSFCQAIKIGNDADISGAVRNLSRYIYNCGNFDENEKSGETLKNLWLHNGYLSMIELSINYPNQKSELSSIPSFRRKEYRFPFSLLDSITILTDFYTHNYKTYHSLYLLASLFFAIYKAQPSTNYLNQNPKSLTAALSLLIESEKLKPDNTVEQVYVLAQKLKLSIETEIKLVQTSGIYTNPPDNIVPDDQKPIVEALKQIKTKLSDLELSLQQLINNRVILEAGLRTKLQRPTNLEDLVHIARTKTYSSETYQQLKMFDS